MVNIQFSVKDVELFSLFSGFTYLFISVLLLWVALTKWVIHLNMQAHGHMAERKFQYKRWGDLCGAPPCSIQAKVLGPQLAWQHVSAYIRWTSEQ